MNRTATLFNQMVAEIPPEVKTELDWSFSIADRIDGILRERKMSQKEFAKVMGKSEAEVSRWLGGTHNFTLRTLAKISTVLGRDVLH